MRGNIDRELASRQKGFYYTFLLMKKVLGSTQIGFIEYAQTDSYWMNSNDREFYPALLCICVASWKTLRDP